MSKIIVVGGGPAGMMAAIRAGQLKQDVALIEKNVSLGRKLLLSGKGRCNLTNDCDLEYFLERFSRSGAFLRDAFKKFFNQDLMRFFRTRGLKLRVERQRRVFPVTDSSDSILGVLLRELVQCNVKILFKTAVKALLVKEQAVRGVILLGGQFIPADKVIMATGGLSYPATGSTGEGLEMSRRLGHTVVPPTAGLVGLEIKEDYPLRLQGLTLKNIRVTFDNGRRRIISDIGELLFTHSGISGPLVLTLSAQVGEWLGAGRRVSVEIDLKPVLSQEQLDARLRREFSSGSRKSIRNVLKTMLPARMISCFLECARIQPQEVASQVTKAQRQVLIELFKGFRMEISRTRPLDEAMVTRGGVSLKAINPRTMESKLIKGLYFAGEMIDVDADTGGFNLQAAFSTGYLAGESAALSG